VKDASYVNNGLSIRTLAQNSQNATIGVLRVEPKGAELMAVEIRRLSDAIGAEILGVDISQPIDDATFEQVHNALLEDAIVLFRDQDITIPQHIDFAKRFGELEIHTVPEDAHPEFPEVLVLSNVEEAGKLVGSPPAPDGGGWHSDYAYKRNPASVSVFHATVAPDIYGDTMFANMYTAYEALPVAMKARIKGLRWRSDRMKVQRSLYPDKVFSEAELANIHDVTHPIVRTHPVSGRKALYLAMRRASLTRIEGLLEGEGIGLVEELRDFATASRFVYSHHWQAGDVMAWDNRGSIHRATPWDERIYKRHAHRVTVMGDVPF
jgi:taurine dioxygenase